MTIYALRFYFINEDGRGQFFEDSFLSEHDFYTSPEKAQAVIDLHREKGSEQRIEIEPITVH